MYFLFPGGETLCFLLAHASHVQSERTHTIHIHATHGHTAHARMPQAHVMTAHFMHSTFDGRVKNDMPAATNLPEPVFCGLKTSICLYSYVLELGSGYIFIVVSTAAICTIAI